MKRILIIIAFLFVELGFAQLTIKKSSIDSGGEVTGSGSITMIYTIGETVVKENTQGNIHISEGFLNPELQESLTLSNYATLSDITIFPNPTIDFVNIDFNNASNYRIEIFDSRGKILAGFHTDENTRLDLSKYSVGTYVLLIRDDIKQLYQSYKIIKK